MVTEGETPQLYTCVCVCVCVCACVCECVCVCEREREREREVVGVEDGVEIRSCVHVSFTVFKHRNSAWFLRIATPSVHILFSYSRPSTRGVIFDSNLRI